MKKLTLALVVVLGFILAACGSVRKPVSPTSPTAVKQSSVTQVQPQPAAQDLTRSDSQGAVTIEVKPENLSNPGKTLIFDISMNTHSIDLSMDLTTLATLSTDNGRSVQALLWDASRGGHHVSGKLSFPASVDGKSILDGDTKLTLTIKDVDAAQRVFTWDLQP